MLAFVGRGQQPNTYEVCNKLFADLAMLEVHKGVIWLSVPKMQDTTDAPNTLRLYIPKSGQIDFIREHHCGVVGGHLRGATFTDSNTTSIFLVRDVDTYFQI